MFKPNEKYEVNRNILKCDYKRYSPSEIGTMNTANYQVSNNIPREDSLIALQNTNFYLVFDVIQATTNNRHADSIGIRLINLGPVALFSNYNMTTSSGQHLEIIRLGHIVSLMYKLRTSAKETDDLFIGFDRDRAGRQRELTNNKNQKGKNHVRIMLRDIFGFVEHQKKTKKVLTD